MRLKASIVAEDRIEVPLFGWPVPAARESPDALPIGRGRPHLRPALQRARRLRPPRGDPRPPVRLTPQASP